MNTAEELSKGPYIYILAGQHGHGIEIRREYRLCEQEEDKREKENRGTLSDLALRHDTIGSWCFGLYDYYRTINYIMRQRHAYS